MTHTYKVGDKVRILHTDYKDESQEIGKIRTVVSVDDCGVDLDYPEGKESGVRDDLYYSFREVEPYIETIFDSPEPTFNLPNIDAFKTVYIEPFSIETAHGCKAEFLPGEFGDVSINIIKDFDWSSEDLRHLAAVLNHLANVIEAIENA